MRNHGDFPNWMASAYETGVSVTKKTKCVGVTGPKPTGPNQTPQAARIQAIKKKKKKTCLPGLACPFSV